MSTCPGPIVYTWDLSTLGGGVIGSALASRIKDEAFIIHWATGGILAIGHALGGWCASRWSVDKGEVWIKRVMIVSIFAMAIKLWFF